MLHQSLTRTEGSAKSTFSAAAEAMRAAFAAFDVPPAAPHQIPEARAFAERLIGGAVASTEALAAVQDATGAALFLVWEAGELTGLHATILLSQEGRKAAETDTLDTLNPARSHVARSDEEPAALYSWGIAASNHLAAKRLFEAFALFAEATVLDIPIFVRPVTADGRRIAIDRTGCEPVPGSTSGLYWIDPAARRRARAAAS